MTAAFLSFSAALFFCIFSSGALASGINLFENFDSTTESCIYQNFLQKERLSIGRYDNDRSISGRVSYSGIGGHGGTVFLCPLPVKSAKYTLVFDVRFDRNFDFVKGGKLLGLGPQKIMSGGNGTDPKGWSARVIFLRDGGVGLYYYHQDQKGRLGDIVRADGFSFELERSYRVRMDLTLNSAPQVADGVIQLFVDGKQLAEKKEIRFRAVGDEALISKFLFSTFHGGSTDAWAPKNPDGTLKTVHAYFDNISLTAN